jgi:ribonuclease HI
MLFWVPSHVEIPRNKEADNAAREALDENLDKTEEYPPQGLGELEQHEEQRTGYSKATHSQIINH